jgi:AcrR family transcriptional regulator
MRTANPDLQTRRRFEITSAAEQCFLKQGFHQTSMQNIATASGLSMGLLYRYFRNKEAIIDAVAQRDRDETVAAIKSLPIDGDAIKAWIAMLIDATEITSAPDYAALASEIFAEASRSSKLRENLQANDAVLTTAIIAKLVEQHRCGAVEMLNGAGWSAQALLLLFDGLTMRKLMTSREHHRLIEQSAESMVRSIFARHSS